MRMRFCVCGAAVACLSLTLIVSPLSAEELTLQQAVGIAVNNNPTVAANRLSAEAAKQSAKGAQALANPEITVAPSVIGDAGSDSAVLLSQPLEINGSRRVRGQIASHEASSAGFNAEAAKRDIVLRVSSSYWDTAQAQESVKLNKDNITYLETVRAAVQKLYDVGAAPGSQVLKMDVELARARQELSQAQLALQQSKFELNSLMGWPTNTDFSVSEPLASTEVTIDRNTLVASALTNRPEIASACELLASAQGQIKAAKLRKVPDLAIQARKGTFDSGEQDGGVAIVVSLPIFDWGSVGAEKRRAQIAAQSQEKQLEAARNSVSLEVDQAIQRLTTATQILREYQSGVLQKSEELAAMARKGYEKGASSYLEVLEAQRTLRSTKSSYYSALAEQAKALAQLEWATGCSVRQKLASEVKK